MTLIKRKIINDPVHGFITINHPLIFAIIEHPYYQRLRRIQQMAMAQLVYQMGVNLQAIGGADFSTGGVSSPDGQSLTFAGFGSNAMSDAFGIADTNVADGISEGGLNVGLLNDNIAVFIRALQTGTDATVLANPRVVTMNKQRGEVLLGRRDGFLTTTVTQTSTTQSVDYLETGTRLIFRPYISVTRCSVSKTGIG